MYLAVKKVKPISDHRLLLVFSNDEQRIFDVKPYLNRGIFSQLQSDAIFNTAHISFDTVEWNNGADLDPELLYAESIQVTGS
ncbi:MAG: DUF2442 domain-containing protein [Nitrospirota bacterium]